MAKKSDWLRAFLAITWEPDFSHICGFHKMLKGNKYIHSTPFPDNTNEKIFLESTEILFLGHSWTFLVIFAWIGFFQKYWALSCLSPYGPLTSNKVSEKTKEPILRKLLERRMDRWRTDGQTLIQRTLPTITRGPKRDLDNQSSQTMKF